MDKFKVLLVLMLTANIGCFSFASVLRSRSLENGISNTGTLDNLRLVATVEGKSFFVEDGTERNWMNSVNLCHSVGLQPAKITSQDQLNALKNAHQSTYFEGEFWTAAIDAILWKDFSWYGAPGDGTGVQTFLPIYLGDYTVSTGLTLKIVPGPELGRLHTHPTLRLFPVLCENILPTKA